MDPIYEPHPDLRRLLVGTPSMLALAAAEVGIAMVAEAGIDRVAAKGRRLTGLAMELCAEAGLATSTPPDPQRRGAHVAVHHPDAQQLVAELAGRGVITDFRQPDIIRVGCSALTTRFVDVWDGIAAIRAAIGAR